MPPIVVCADKLYVVTEPRVRKHLDPRALCRP